MRCSRSDQRQRLMGGGPLLVHGFFLAQHAIAFEDQGAHLEQVVDLELNQFGAAFDLTWEYWSRSKVLKLEQVAPKWCSSVR